MRSSVWLVAAGMAALTTPAGAQLVGGGIGGGLGGGVGGLSGSIDGGLGATLTRPTLDTKPVDRVTREVQARARPERRAAQTRSVQDAADAADLAGHPIGFSGAVQGSGTAATGAPGGVAARGAGGADLRLLAEPSLRTRGAVAATARGMRRVTATASGVPVFVPQAVIAAPGIVRPPVAYYPAYSGAYYYGASPVVIRETEVRTYMDGQQRDFERGLAGTGATVRRQGDDLVVALPADVTFAFDKADIRPRFYGALSAFARTLAAYPGTDIEIEGHTDAVGSDVYNLALSERRGRAVADYLAAAQIDPARMVVEAFGKSEPIASNATVAGRAANRRVELIVHPRAR